MDDFIRVMVDLVCRRDRILEKPEPDLSVLSGDCEAAGLACAAAVLRRRLEWIERKYS